MDHLNTYPSSKLKQLKELFEEKEAIRQLRVENKLTKKEHKQLEKKRKHSIRVKQYWFNFFTKWFFLGIVLIIISICLSMYVEKIPLQSNLYIAIPILNIFSNLLSTVGIALFIGCIFDFSKNSEAFIRFVSNILSDIVVSKNFLSTLSAKDKEQALNLILKPMDAQVEQYSNINAFFQKKIKESMTMFDTNFKTNVIMDIEAHKDTAKNIVYCETTLTYTVYSLHNEYQPIEILFEKDNSVSSNIKIISPLNKLVEVDKGKPTEKVSGGIKYQSYIITIPDECKSYDHLTIKRQTYEPGKDHWIHYIWQSLTPYEGITCKVKCYDNLTIKDFMIFDNKAYYYVYESDDKTRIDITSSQWLDADTGFSFVISE